MKVFLSIRKILFLAVLLTGCMARAAGDERYWTPDKLPMVHLQDASRYVVNPDGVLRPATVDSADRLLAALERETGVQSVTIVVNHIEGDDPYSFGQALADRYGIGHRGRDDGLIVIICPGDRSYTILTGKGLEGVLPDALCHRIEQKEMVPLLKQGLWDEALIATLVAIDRCVRQDEEMMAYLEEHDNDGWTVAFACLGVCTILMLLLSLFVGRKRCPSCKSRRLKRLKFETITKKGGKYINHYEYRCKRCGHTFSVDKEYSSYYGGRSSHGYFGGGFGGYSGHSGGGSFGGGSFGGGGSSGRF